MVSATLVDSLKDPSGELLRLYRKVYSEGPPVDFPDVVSAHFSSVFPDDDALDQIPLLCVDQPPHLHRSGSLVRFRAMVQDTSRSPEMYLSSISAKEPLCGGWGIENEVAPEEEHDGSALTYETENLRDRTVVWAVNIPGEAPWCALSADPNWAPSTGSELVLPSHQRPHKYPIPNSDHIAVQIKVYGSSGEQIKPTELYIFVGILTSDQEHSDFAVEAHVPTLHVLFHRELPKSILTRTYPSGTYTLALRQALKSWIANAALGGDHDAAEWVLLSCISSVRSRNPPLFPPLLALSNFPRPSTSTAIPSLHVLLSEVLPICSLVPLSLRFLNGESFEPNSKEEDLHAGVLQVPSGTTIIVSESGMEEGILDEKGLRNVQALRDVSKFQTLRYNFPYSHFSFPTDITIVVLTDGKKSLFCEPDITVPLHHDPSANLYQSKELITSPGPSILSAFRDLILSAKSGKVEIESDISQYIQNEFVQERRRERSTTPEDLTRRISIARLFSLSCNEEQMSLDTWNKAKELETRRQSRLL